jgi:non-heme chloroperoxidase
MEAEAEMATTSDAGLQAWEDEQIERANDLGHQPVVFVHGLWLLSSSWDRWRDVFDAAGYATLAPGWPDDPNSVEEGRAHPERFADKMVEQVTEHYRRAIAGLDRRPVVIGHSFGGLIAQKLAGEGLAAATVAIDNAPFRGVLPVPVSSLRSASAVFGHPERLHRGVMLSFEQFVFGWANNLPEEEARALYERFHVPASAVPLFQAAVANFNPFGGDTAVETKATNRGPLLIIAGEQDNTVPLAITRASYKLQSANSAETEITEVPDRGHSLTIDHGWAEVADIALRFVQRFA